MRSIKTATGLALGLLLTTFIAATPVMAQTEMAVNYQWTAPTSGSAVDHYVVQQSVNGGSWVQIATASSTSYTLNASVGDAHSIRVAGVDADGRQGIYSAASDPYTPDLGNPGQPGKPIIF
jgi:hypothetical protein